jgi:hypothetical protein
MNTDTEQAAEQDTEPRWKHQLTGGSRKGIPNKQTVAIKDAIERAFTKLGGTDYLVHVGRSDPRTFCALLSRLLPTRLSNADGSPLLAALTELTDAQLEARTARALQDAQRAGLMAGSDGVSSAQVLEVQAEVVQSDCDVTYPAYQRSEQDDTEKSR